MSNDTGEPGPNARWVPTITLGGECTLKQRQRNFAIYQRLKDGDHRPSSRSSTGLAGFVYDVPIERMRIAPDGKSFSFRLQKDDECLYRLIHVVTDHFDESCDADDEVERLKARIAELEAQPSTGHSHVVDAGKPTEFGEEK
jgi:hypothetical protein